MIGLCKLLVQVGFPEAATKRPGNGTAYLSDCGKFSIQIMRPVSDSNQLAIWVSGLDNRNWEYSTDNFIIEHYERMVEQVAHKLDEWGNDKALNYLRQRKLRLLLGEDDES